jgi:hypothetical protein
VVTKVPGLGCRSAPSLVLESVWKLEVWLACWLVSWLGMELGRE